MAATRFHMTPAEWDDCPAELCTWLLAIDGVVEEVRAETQRRARDRRR